MRLLDAFAMIRKGKKVTLFRREIVFCLDVQSARA